MKTRVFIATRETQGYRKNDFDFCEDGELVVFPMMECDREEVDGDCGCRRSMIGLDCGKATTTFKIVEHEITIPDLVTKIHEHYKRNGWDKLMSDDELHNLAETEITAIQSIVLRYIPGTIMERRGINIQNRTIT